jgi:tetratricopeptide (TPR) repeat protein
MEEQAMQADPHCRRRPRLWKLLVTLGLAGVLAATIDLIPAAGLLAQVSQPDEPPDELGVLAVASDQESDAETVAPSAVGGTDIELGPPVGDDLGPLEPVPMPEENPQIPPLATASDSPQPLDAAADGVAGQHAREGLPESARGPAVRPHGTAADGGSERSPAVDAQVKIEPAGFLGVLPGTSTIEQVTKAWGEPIDVAVDEDDLPVHIHDVDDFTGVQVRYKGQVVTSIVVPVDAPMEAGELAAELGLEQVRTVDIVDARGRRLGRAFPERGVVFGFDARDAVPRVQQVILEPIDAEPFVARAASHLHGPYQANLRDLDYAIRNAPDYARPYWLRARVLLATGQVASAEHAAASAVGLAPTMAEYRLTWAQCLTRLGRDTDAMAEVEKVIGRSDLPAVIKSQALMVRGDLVARGGNATLQKKAVDYHVAAIKLLSPLATDRSPMVRRSARRLLIDAHLAVANDIAWGRWQRQPQVVPMWITAASKLADRTIGNDSGSRELRLRVARESLRALAGVQPPSDPAAWIAKAERAAAEAAGEWDDALWSERIRRQLGMAYFRALQMAHNRGDVAQGVRYGQQALANLAIEADNEDGTLELRHLVGQIRFQMGAILAVHREDHDRAIRWYDLAVPDLMQPTPASPLAERRRHGDALVSMGVSYWEVGQRSKALELTLAGTDMIEQAVTKSAVDKAALSVPYGNLATMHQIQGNLDKAERFADLAKTSRR